jgi:dTDP-4-dehydrorhamnose 3,5-epimerase
MGAACDVIVDLRKDSPTYCQWLRVEITATNRLAVYVPPGFGHGFQTLLDETELFYQMTEFYVPELAGGARWNDPAFGIQWPLSEAIISERDNTFADFPK